MNIYTVYQLGASSSHNNDPTLKNCLFRAFTLSMVILVMVLDLIEDPTFHFQVTDLVKM